MASISRKQLNIAYLQISAQHFERNEVLKGKLVFLNVCKEPRDDELQVYSNICEVISCGRKNFWDQDGSATSSAQKAMAIYRHLRSLGFEKNEIPRSLTNRSISEVEDSGVDTLTLFLLACNLAMGLIGVISVLTSQSRPSIPNAMGHIVVGGGHNQGLGSLISSSPAISSHFVSSGHLRNTEPNLADRVLTRRGHNQGPSPTTTSRVRQTFGERILAWRKHDQGVTANPVERRNLSSGPHVTVGEGHFSHATLRELLPSEVLPQLTSSEGSARDHIMLASTRPDPSDRNNYTSTGTLECSERRVPTPQEFLDTLEKFREQLERFGSDALKEQISSLKAQIDQLRQNRSQLDSQALAALRNAVFAAMGAGTQIECPPLFIAAIYTAVDQFQAFGEIGSRSAEVFQQIERLSDLERSLEAANELQRMSDLRHR